VAEIVSPAL